MANEYAWYIEPQSFYKEVEKIRYNIVKSQINMYMISYQVMNLRINMHYFFMITFINVIQNIVFFVSMYIT